MNPRLETALKALLLLATAYFLFGRITGGTLAFYINERFTAYTIFAVIGLLVVALSYPMTRRRSNDTTHEETQNHLPTQTHSHDHGHDHGLTWSGAFIVALPILLGLLVTPRPLGAAAMASREVNVVDGTRSAMPAAVRAAAAKSSTERTVLDWTQAFQTVEDPAAHFGGEAADVVGFVYRDERFGDDQFFLTRFVVSCCVADAAVAGLVVRAANAADLEPDQWLRISGTLAPGAFDGASVPLLIAEQITPIDVPDQPYLYP